MPVSPGSVPLFIYHRYLTAYAYSCNPTTIDIVTGPPILAPPNSRFVNQYEGWPVEVVSRMSKYPMGTCFVHSPYAAVGLALWVI